MNNNSYIIIWILFLVFLILFCIKFNLKKLKNIFRRKKNKENVLSINKNEYQYDLNNNSNFYYLLINFIKKKFNFFHKPKVNNQNKVIYLEDSYENRQKLIKIKIDFKIKKIERKIRIKRKNFKLSDITEKNEN